MQTLGDRISNDGLARSPIREPSAPTSTIHTPVSFGVRTVGHQLPNTYTHGAYPRLRYSSSSAIKGCDLFKTLSLIKRSSQAPIHSCPSKEYFINNDYSDGMRSTSNSKIIIDEALDENNPYYDGEKTQIPISQDAGFELYQHWIDQAFSGLMAAVATKKMERLHDHFKEEAHQCSKKAKTLKQHAECVVRLLDLEKNPKNHAPLTTKKNSTVVHGKDKPEKLHESKNLGMKMSTKIRRVNSFEAKSSEARRRQQHAQKTLQRVRAGKQLKGSSKRKPIKTSSRSRSSSRSHSRPSSHSSERTLRRKSIELIERNNRPRRKLRINSHKVKGVRRQPKNVIAPGRTQVVGQHNPTGNSINDNDLEGDEWVGAFKVPKRMKRHIVNKDSYTLLSDMDRSPFGLVAKHITNAIRQFKKKDEHEMKNWKSVITEIEQKGREIKMKRKMKKLLMKRFETMSNAAKDMDFDSSEVDSHRPLAMPKLDELEEEDERTEMLNEAKKRLSNMTDDEKAMQAPVQILRDAVKLGMTLSGQNTSDFDNKSIKVISPRFLSIVPEDDENKKDRIDLLSPSLFALHEGDEGDEISRKTSLHNALSGISNDGNALLDMIIEASGVGDAVKYIKDEKMTNDEREELRGPDGKPLYWTKENVTTHLGEFEARKVDVMEQLQRMYTPEQIERMKETGYASLTPRQADFIYGPRSPYNNTAALKRYKPMNRTSLDNAITRTIRDIATERAKFAVRQKDIVLSPLANAHIILDPTTASQAIILSPVVTSSLILSPAVFGSVILSPWLFVACILSPRVLSPVILNPFGFVPIILSPLALVPVVLSPGIFNPFVLSPLVLSPFILSPQAFTPLILSPFALNPFILTPNLMSPIILSPFVLSPIILSPAYVSALVLSPYALSPLIQSNGALVSIVASPSILS